MSYLNNARPVFTGRFQAGVSTIDNDAGRLVTTAHSKKRTDMPTQRSFLVTAFLAIAALPVRAEDFWGRMLSDQPANFVFGYGSLINTASRNATSTHPIAAFPRASRPRSATSECGTTARLLASRRSACASLVQARAL